MEDFVRWLGAQFDEDERIARGADPGPWKSDSLGRHDQAAIKLGAPTSTSLIQFDGSRAAANGVHVARHDPARVLREIDAKRRVVAECAYWNEKLSQEAADPPKFPYPCLGEILDAVNPILRALASAYADRPGYREDWAP